MLQCTQGLQIDGDAAVFPVADFGDPYESVREYWGEELTPTLADRIVDAPVDHLDHFQSFLNGLSSCAKMTLPDLPPGELRPVISTGAIDFIYGNNAGLAVAKLAPSLLIYAHQLVVNDVSYGLCSTDAERRRGAADWLIAVKPLFDDGLIHFRIIDSRKRHPSWRKYYNHLDENINNIDDSDINCFVEQCTQVIDAKEHMAEEEWNRFKGDILYQLIIDASSFYGFERLWPNKVHRLLRSKAEHTVMRAIFEQAAAIDGDADVLRLLNLSQLVMPGFTTDIRSLVSVRRSEEEFAQFRHHLATALSQLDLRDRHDSVQLAAARKLIYAECEPMRARVNSAMKKSPALEALRVGTVGFGVSLLAAVGGFAVGGNLTSAATSAAVAKVSDAALEYVRAYKRRKKAERVADFVATFYSPDQLEVGGV